MTGDRPDVPPRGDRPGAPPRDGPGLPPAEQAAAFVNEVEGHLLAHAERERARREAEALCARLPWLTGAQAEDVTRHYTEQRLDLTRELLRATIARAAELRGEYEARYTGLRRSLLKRHAACAATVLACAAAVSTVPTALTR
ncbi:hypothetical protein [Streptomyces poonensis]|uniref:Uncharacterized protein n=1 Tax=Streptomyces poonensis TaxID=68255 RepID=A0A918PJF9_9ACTN|nr:hypothetical protein [Streptomyces poonensis]GGZ12898.1 hypothetical protein GCM10010365_35780 [Streptomyces poonensis]GLJ91967.1 hypothetical protein GCM10017589_45750 [Streptomyces poonensis]